MKTLLLLICLAAISSLSSSAAIGRQSNSPMADSWAGGVAFEGAAPAVQRARSKQAALRAQGKLDGLRGTVVSEMRATKAFVKENVNVVKQGSADRKLMLLAAIGMIVLQLRRKHKSLPQRQIAPYA
ncbi:MAG TPA: hypothetical protein VGI90_12165 [Steroidobacteraceae bacterium]|jgi:hypothetical protein